jgi:hypothetical protein
MSRRELVVVKEEETVCGGRLGGTGAPGVGAAMSVFTDSPPSGANAAM